MERNSPDRGGPTPEFVGQLTASQSALYAFIGALDKTVPPERSERMITAIQKAGGREAKLKVYPDEGHNAGRIVVAEQEFYDWMFSKKRN